MIMELMSPEYTIQPPYHNTYYIDYFEIFLWDTYRKYDLVHSMSSNSDATSSLSQSPASGSTTLSISSFTPEVNSFPQLNAPLRTRNRVKGRRKGTILFNSSSFNLSLYTILKNVGLERYYHALQANGFNNWTDVLQITEKQMSLFGFKLGHRRILQREIASYNHHLYYESLSADI